MAVPQKIKNETTISSSSLIYEYLSEENENTNLKRYMLHYVHCRIISNKPLKQPKCASMDEWIKQLVYIENGILFGHKKNEILPLWQQKDFRRTVLCEISQRKTHGVWFHLYVESKKKKSS